MDTVNREPILFGDYRNALTEDPRLYEDIVDYEAAKAIFDEVGNLVPFPFDVPLIVIYFIFIPCHRKCSHSKCRKPTYSHHAPHVCRMAWYKILMHRSLVGYSMYTHSKGLHN